MPEMPEIQAHAERLTTQFTGRVLERFTPFNFTALKTAVPAPDTAYGLPLIEVGRRGKYLMLELDDGNTVVIHLRMTGSLILVDPEGVENPGDARIYEADTSLKHLKARFGLDDGGEIRFTDPRRFGRGFVAGQSELDAYFGSRLGVEPLSPEFTVESMASMTAKRTGPLKSFLLNQKGVVGVGNIYADEALFRAKLHPLTTGGALKHEHHVALRDGVVEALERGLDLGGASIDDYRDAKGETGSMQDEFLVHRREGEDCHECGQTIVRIVVGGRSTYYCPDCQVKLRRPPRKRKPKRG